MFDAQDIRGKKAMIQGLIDKVFLSAESVDVVYNVDIAATVNSVIDGGEITADIAKASPILADFTKPAKPILGTHRVQRTMPYVKGQRGRIDANRRKPLPLGWECFCAEGVYPPLRQRPNQAKTKRPVACLVQTPSR